MKIEILQKIFGKSENRRNNVDLGLLDSTENIVTPSSDDETKPFKTKDIIKIHFERYLYYLTPRKQDPRWYKGDGVKSCWPPPIAMILLSIIEIILHVSDNISGGQIAASLVYDPRLKIELWRYLTFMLVHKDVLHICYNIFVQIILGIPLEIAHSWWKVLLLYLSGIFASCLAATLTNSYVQLVGASGGVFALLTAQLPSILVNWNVIQAPGLKLVIHIWFLSVSTYLSVFNDIETGTSDTNHWAHGMGALTGLLIGYFIIENAHTTTTKSIIAWTFLAVFLSTTCFAILWNIFNTSYYPPQIHNSDAES